jgi:hypothetical protein
MNTSASRLPDWEPTLVTDPALKGILAELSSLEPIFHRPELGSLRSDFEKQTVEDFWEVGASGRRYSREFVLDVLEERASVPPPDVWETSDFYCRRLGEDTYLLTYTLLQEKARLTRRSTIWQTTPDGWKMVYHQGTVVQDA